MTDNSELNNIRKSKVSSLEEAYSAERDKIIIAAASGIVTGNLVPLAHLFSKHDYLLGETLSQLLVDSIQESRNSDFHMQLVRNPTRSATGNLKIEKHIARMKTYKIFMHMLHNQAYKPGGQGLAADITAEEIRLSPKTVENAWRSWKNTSYGIWFIDQHKNEDETVRDLSEFYAALGQKKK